MGHVDVNAVSYSLPDGRPLLDEVSFRVGEGARVALIGPNGTGKTTLLRIIAGDLDAHAGAVTRSGGLGVMRQFIGSVRDDTTGPRPARRRRAAAPIRGPRTALETAELAMMERDDEPAQMALRPGARGLGRRRRLRARDAGTSARWPRSASPYEQAQWRDVRTLSGGEQKRLVLEALLRGPDEVLLLDEPDNYLDVPAKRWLEERLLATPKTVLFVSHDRELLARVADPDRRRWSRAAPGRRSGCTGRFASYHEARADRNSRLEELRRRWDEEHAKLKALVADVPAEGGVQLRHGPRYQAAQTRLRRFEEAGPPEVLPFEQRVRMRLRGGRTGKRAVICEGLELTGLMQPFDLEVWFGERVGVLGSNGSGKSHFLRLLARGGSDPDVEHRPVGDVVPAPVDHRGAPGWAPGCGRAGSPRPTSTPS